MGLAEKILFSVYGLAFLALLIILIYLLFRRLEIREKENFEKREN